MIKERYCSFEVSKLLREKGFDESIYEFYNSTGIILYARNKEGFRLSELNGVYYPHITHQMAMDWLRKEYGILISIIPQEVKIGVDKLCYAIYRITEDLYQPLYNGEVDNFVDSYGETVEAALKYCLTKLMKGSEE